MKKFIELFVKENGLDLCEEKVVRRVLEKAGLYSDDHVFPIASLQLELTSHCNLYCKHCYNNSGMANNVKDNMTASRWINFAHYLVQKGGIFECILSGGEPFLLGDSLFEIMDILHDDGTCFMLLTNGHFITAEKAKRLRKYRYHWLQVSIDGINAEQHDFFRQFKGSWQKAVDAARLVSSNHIPLKIAHCVTPNNLEDVDEMCDFAYSLGASSIILGELCLSGRVADNMNLLLTNKQRRILFQKIDENYHKYHGLMRVKRSNSVYKGLKRHQNKPNSGAVIRPNGDIRLDSMAPFIIGNILQDDFASVWSEKLRKSWNSCDVDEYINGFDRNDRNYSQINYVNDDMYI